ncbi:hypothetical protein PAPYR_7808 [Paratrimastix pyriformis]|uniref:Uncharacterized protein n=1 Tax=Paratrimastix pyriformis TaxID=342808 RepID=A0ABQ8UC69_9EUKA|nr:hypothetical protein PAPYR_7808 [Paratrimastix pyriformis]
MRIIHRGHLSGFCCLTMSRQRRIEAAYEPVYPRPNTGAHQSSEAQGPLSGLCSAHAQLVAHEGDCLLCAFGRLLLEERNTTASAIAALENEIRRLEALVVRDPQQPPQPQSNRLLPSEAPARAMIPSPPHIGKRRLCISVLANESPCQPSIRRVMEALLAQMRVEATFVENPAEIPPGSMLLYVSVISTPRLETALKIQRFQEAHRFAANNVVLVLLRVGNVACAFPTYLEDSPHYPSGVLLGTAREVKGLVQVLVTTQNTILECPQNQANTDRLRGMVEAYAANPAVGIATTQVVQQLTISPPAVTTSHVSAAYATTTTPGYHQAAPVYPQQSASTDHHQEPAVSPYSSSSSAALAATTYTFSTSSSSPPHDPKSSSSFSPPRPTSTTTITSHPTSTSPYPLGVSPARYQSTSTAYQPSHYQSTSPSQYRPSSAAYGAEFSPTQRSPVKSTPPTRAAPAPPAAVRVIPGARPRTPTTFSISSRPPWSR